jgi:hypothetical protein
MVQTARSGKQNIVEASKASGTSRETELKLTNVARASLEELLLDYRDFEDRATLLTWFAGTFKGAEKFGYTHHFATFNQDTIEEVKASKR